MVRKKNKVAVHQIINYFKAQKKNRNDTTCSNERRGHHVYSIRLPPPCILGKEGIAYRWSVTCIGSACNTSVVMRDVREVVRAKEQLVSAVLGCI